MRHLTFYLLTTLALVASCSVKEDNGMPQDRSDVIFYARFEQPSENGTKVYANEDLYLRWTADDRVSIFNKITYNQQYRFLGETGDNAGGFRKVDPEEFISGASIPHVVSVYPYAEATKLSSNEVLTVTLPAEQHYAANTFGLGDNTMVSVSTDNVLEYKNVGGYLRLRLYGEGVVVSSVTLRGNNGEKLAGKALVTMPLGGVPSVEMADDATFAITLACETPVALGATADESTDFWFVVPPVTFSKGFTVSVNQTAGGVFQKSTAKSVTVTRSEVVSMAPLEMELLSGNVIQYTTSDEQALTLAHPEFGDAVIVSHEYEDGMGCIIFDRDVTVIGNQAFGFCSTLTDITIPDSVTSLGDGAFYFCSGLSNLTIPESVTSVGSAAFALCSGLVSLSIPAGVTSIGDGITAGCVNLESIVVDPDNSFYDSRENCNAIIESDSGKLFAACKNSFIPDGVTVIGVNAFSGCHDMIGITVPGSVTSLLKGAFFDCCDLTEIVLPAGVTEIGESAFEGCTSLASITLYAVIPPTGGADMFFDTNECPIYVPFGSVAAYKAAEFWIDYADRIQGLVHVPEAVDLGLPSGLKWASFNLGASKAVEYGDYYAWGEIETYYTSLDPLIWKNRMSYWVTSYKWCNGSSTTLTKYNTDPAKGTVDGRTVLEPEDDVAQVMLGELWRMPTEEEWAELRDCCTWTWTTVDGVPGEMITSKMEGFTDQWIFLPAAGHWAINGYYNPGSNGSYWSSSLDTDDTTFAWYLDFNSDRIKKVGFNRWYGRSIRPLFGAPTIPLESIALDKTSLEISVGSEDVLHATISPVNATYSEVIWSSSKPSVATVSAAGVVTAVALGQATITATSYSGKTATCQVTVVKPAPPVPTAVDLGLPSGLKWASFNLGASKAVEYGDYYAWGEIETSYDSLDPLIWNGKSYWVTSYKWCNGSPSTLTKYNTDPANGTVDGRTVLEPEDDVAQVMLGELWRMPTGEEWAELLNCCTWTWTTVDGVPGEMITSKMEGFTDQWIFLPAAGHWAINSYYNPGSNGSYWSSSLYTDNTTFAWYLDFYSDRVSTTRFNRWYGRSIRPLFGAPTIPLESIALDKTSLEMLVRSEDVLHATISPVNATFPEVTWSSSKTSVATVSAAGVVTAVGPGQATITATSYSGKTATCQVTVKRSTAPVPTAVDLGLPSGLKWASFNLGASKPEEHGDYYAWGEVEPYYEPGYAQSETPVWKPGKEAGYDWGSYKLCKGTSSTLTKYCINSSYGYNGYSDRLTILEPQDDAAYVNLGGGWRMPNNADVAELREKCTWVWTTVNGVSGDLVTGPNGNSIFLPASGARLEQDFFNLGSYGDYWSANVKTNPPGQAAGFYFFSQVVQATSYSRVSGHTIRPVTY